MEKRQTIIKMMVWILMGVLLLSHASCPALAYESTTLRNGSRGENVRVLQQALIDLGYLRGTADGIFGNNTENAVRSFQKKNKLNVDGLAGKKTQEQILRMAEEQKKPVSAGKPSNTPVPESVPNQSDRIFSGNYSTIRNGDKGKRVTLLQNALISVGTLTGKADGVFGKNTLNAVKKFQKSKKLTADGLAGKKTLVALEKAVSDSTPKSSSSPKPTATPKPSSGNDLNEHISPPAASALKLLHWFNDIKPSLSNGQKLLIYEPGSGLSWTLRIMSRGRHCDAEPLTAKDTRTMIKAFGGSNTWSQKAVFVKLPDGVWTIGSTHDMPHDSGTIKDNDFNGHLCVHFLRDMAEAKKNDPSYGVANQETIRKYWKKWTGQEIKE